MPRHHRSAATSSENTSQLRNIDSDDDEDEENENEVGESNGPGSEEDDE